MALKVEVRGIDILLRDLDSFSDKMEKEIAEEIVDWANRTVTAAKSDVPVDTGALRSSIRAVVGKDRKTMIVKAGGVKGVDYAPYIEFGTGTFVDQSFLQEYGLIQYAQQFKGRGIRQVNLPSRPYLYPNARREFAKSLERIKKLIQTFVK
jgi:HK97 gp10 family phage protein